MNVKSFAIFLRSTGIWPIEGGGNTYRDMMGKKGQLCFSAGRNVNKFDHVFVVRGCCKSVWGYFKEDWTRRLRSAARFVLNREIAQKPVRRST